jgi:hypothetical protein
VDALAIIIVVFAVLVLLLGIGGYLATRRKYDAEGGALHARAQEADQQLAAARAEDKGWERSTLEAAARRAYAARHDRDPVALTLVQVVDRPGTEEDEAVFDADGERLVLGRTGDGWTPRG